MTTLSSSMVSLEDFLEKRKRASMGIWAETGIGKTRFCFTCPKPVFYLSFEPDGPYWALKNALRDGVIKEGDVQIIEVIREAFKNEGDIPLVKTLEEEIVIYEFALKTIQEIIDNYHTGTVAIDTGTEFWHLVDAVEGEAIVKKRAKQGKDRFPFDYRVSNRAFRSVIDSVNASDLNLIVTNHAQEKYSSKGVAQPGKFNYQGNKHLSKWVDVFMRLHSDGNGNSIERWAEIEKCRLDDTLREKEIVDPTWDEVMSVLYPND